MVSIKENIKAYYMLCELSEENIPDLSINGYNKAVSLILYNEVSNAVLDYYGGYYKTFERVLLNGPRSIKAGLRDYLYGRGGLELENTFLNDPAGVYLKPGETINYLKYEGIL